jgi:electron transfer flavoprotein alpha subunit
MLLRTGTVLCRRALTRSYATGTSPHALVFLEHQNGDIESGSLSALTAAKRLGGKVTGLIAGSENDVDEVLQKARK